MSKNLKIAEFYFQSYLTYFWKWDTDPSLNDEDANCVSTFNDITIAYKPQLQEVIDVISLQKIPSFGAILLAFVATNIYGSSNTILNTIFDRIAHIINKENFRHKRDIHFDEAKAFLNTLSQLDNEHKQDKNRIILFSTVFKEIHSGIHQKYADDIKLLLENKANELEPCLEQNTLPWATILRDFRVLGLLHKVFPDVDSIYSALQNLPDTQILEDEEILETEPSPNSKDFISLLTEESKTYFVGSLVKRLWSGLQLPFKQTHPGEMPIGGVSDITNKGNFQNLLITEFANDDQTFLYRIANNEALFIRREVTPEEDLRTRVFLIDTTLKNWGTPKILNYASAIALIKHPKNTMQFLPYAVHDSYHELNFDSVKDVIESLDHTSALIDASRGIEKLITDFYDEDIEITLFTSVKTLHHPNIERLLNQNHNKFAHILATDTLGNILMYQIKRGSKHLVKQISLPLDTLWNNPPKKQKETTLEALDILEVDDYPILFGRISTTKAIFYYGKHQYVLHKKGRLFRKQAPKKGFKMLKAPLQFSTGIKNILAATIFENLPTIMHWGKGGTLVVRNKLSKYQFKGTVTDELIEARISSFFNIDETLYISAYFYGNYYGSKYYEISIEENEIIKLESPSKAVENYLDKYSNVLHSYESGSVFTNINYASITNKSGLVFNHLHTINIDKRIVYSREHETPETSTEAIRRSRELLEFADGSQVKIDRYGILTFISSDSSIPKFYMPSVLDQDLCFATDEVFTGNPYFYGQKSTLVKISIEDFMTSIYKPFINHIIRECS